MNLSHYKAYYARPAGINWPKPLADLFTAYDKAWDAYDQARLDHAEAEAQRDTAAQKDNAAFLTAATTGKPDPGTPNSTAQARAVEYADQVVNMHAGKVDAAQAAIENALPTHTHTLVLEACRVEREHIDAYTRALEEAQRIATRAAADAHTIGEALNFIAPLTHDHVTYTASPVIDEPTWPNPTVIAQSGGIAALVTTLERVYTTTG